MKKLVIVTMISVFQYHGSDNPNDTFTVTIQIKGPGNYKPVFNSGPQF